MTLKEPTGNVRSNIKRIKMCTNWQKIYAEIACYYMSYFLTAQNRKLATAVTKSVWLDVNSLKHVLQMACSISSLPCYFSIPNRQDLESTA